MCRFPLLCLELLSTSYREKLIVLLVTDTSVSWVSGDQRELSRMTVGPKAYILVLLRS